MWHQAKVILGLVLLGSVIQPLSVQAEAGLSVVDGKAVLTVTGEGYRHRQVYENGEQPALSGYDSSGQPLPDGEYRYQLRSIPADSVTNNTQQQLLSGEATSLKTGKTSSSTVQSGKFDVQGGSVIYH